VLGFNTEWNNRSDLPDCTINIRLASKEEFEPENKYGIDIGRSEVVTKYNPVKSIMEIVVNPDITVEKLSTFMRDYALKALYSLIEKSHE